MNAVGPVDWSHFASCRISDTTDRVGPEICASRSYSFSCRPGFYLADAKFPMRAERLRATAPLGAILDANPSLRRPVQLQWHRGADESRVAAFLQVKRHTKWLREYQSHFGKPLPSGLGLPERIDNLEVQVAR